MTSCAPTVVKVPVSTGTPLSDNSLSGRLLSEVNNYRASTGSGSLVRNAGLDRMAQEHSEYMRAHRGSFNLHGSNISHMGFEGRALRARANLNMSTVAENVASAKTNSMPAIAKMWVNSKGHAYNMRGKTWTQTGIGVVVDKDGTVFATQLFGAPRASSVAFDDPLRQH